MAQKHHRWWRPGIGGEPQDTGDIALREPYAKWPFGHAVSYEMIDPFGGLTHEIH